MWVFPKIGVPQNSKWMVYYGKPLLKWMIWVESPSFKEDTHFHVKISGGFSALELRSLIRCQMAMFVRAWPS